jgi:hypothetical protein
METESLTALLKSVDTSLNAATILSALKRTGHLAEIEYPSTTGSGVLKTYSALSASGLTFGINKPTMHPFKTEARFFQSQFHTLLKIVALQIQKETSGLK